MGNSPQKKNAPEEPHNITFNPTRKCRHEGCIYKRKYEKIPADSFCQFNTESLQQLNQKDAETALHILTERIVGNLQTYIERIRVNQPNVVPFLIARYPVNALSKRGITAGLHGMPVQHYKLATYHTYVNLLNVFENGGIGYYMSETRPSFNMFTFTKEQNDRLLTTLVSIEGARLHIVMEKLVREPYFINLPKEEGIKIWKLACYSNSGNYDAFLTVNTSESTTSYSKVTKEERREIYKQACSSPMQKMEKIIIDEFRDDDDVCKVAIKRHGHTLQYVSDRLKNNKELCMIAVGQYGSALEYASDTMKRDYDVVLKAISNFGVALRYASDELKDNHDLAVVALLQSKGAALHHVSKRLQQDSDIVRTAISLDGRSIRSAHSTFLSDPISCSIAVSKNPWSIEFIGELGKKHRDILLRLACRALQKEWRVLSFIPKCITWMYNKDVSIQLALAAMSGWSGSHISNECKHVFLLCFYYKKYNQNKNGDTTMYKWRRKLPVHLIRTIIDYAATRIPIKDISSMIPKIIKQIPASTLSIDVLERATYHNPSTVKSFIKFFYIEKNSKLYAEYHNMNDKQKFRNEYYNDGCFKDFKYCENIITPRLKKIAIHCVSNDSSLLSEFQSCNLFNDKDVLLAALNCRKNDGHDGAILSVINNINQLYKNLKTLEETKNGETKNSETKNTAVQENELDNAVTKLLIDNPERALPSLFLNYMDKMYDNDGTSTDDGASLFFKNINYDFSIPSNIILKIIKNTRSREKAMEIMETEEKNKIKITLLSKAMRGNRTQLLYTEHFTVYGGEIMLSNLNHLTYEYIKEENAREKNGQIINDKINFNDQFKKVVSQVCRGMDINELFIECVKNGGGVALCLIYTGYYKLEEPVGLHYLKNKNIINALKEWENICQSNIKKQIINDKITNLRLIQHVEDELKEEYTWFYRLARSCQRMYTLKIIQYNNVFIKAEASKESFWLNRDNYKKMLDYTFVN